MSEKCRWCDPPRETNCIIKVLDNGRLVWVGCPDCYVKKKELEKHAEKE